jgi:hypothetical protein
VQFVAGQLQLDLGDLSSGMYLISIINPDEAHSIRFVKE